MASCQTSQWVSTAPYVKLTVTESSSTATTSTLSWTLQYIASSAASTSNDKGYSISINNNPVKVGYFNINGKTGTHTICTGTTTINKTTSVLDISFSISFDFSLTWSGEYVSTLFAYGSIKIPTITKYTIAYNTNGGTGAISSQVKWHGTNITLSSATPTRVGYIFQGWGTSASDTTVDYTPNATYSANASITLYAIWAAGTYTVTYKSNGGTGAPASQTKKHGVALTLSSTKPTMTHHTFKGWGTSASSTTVSYAAGASYTTNASITLYAIWERSYTPPIVSKLIVYRCDSNGTASDSGGHAKLDIEYTLYTSCASILHIEWFNAETGDFCGQDTIEYTASSSVSDSILLENELDFEFTLDPDITYRYSVYISDDKDTNIYDVDLRGTMFAIDFTNGSKGPGVSLGKPAEKSGVFEVALDNEFQGTTVQLGNRYTMSSPGIAATSGYVHMASIAITAANADTPITFVISRRRAVAPMTLYVTFNNSTATASDISTFTYEGDNYDAYLIQTSEMVWDLYVFKGSAYDTLTLQDWYTSHTMESRVSVTFPGDLITTLPTPYHKATPAKLASLLDHIYPINSIYISYSNTNPGTLFGGTWARLQNAFLWGCDSSGTIGQTGGEKTHTLTINEIPEHTHKIAVAHTTTGSIEAANVVRYNSDATSYRGTVTTAKTSGGEAHNNMPPYVQVAIWRRTG